MNIIETHGLTKLYGGLAAVDGLEMRVPKGAVYGFLGPNGAGKSTAMKLLLGLTRPSGGWFSIDGKRFPQDRNAILRQTGSLIEAPAFYANLTGEENLDILRRMLGLPKSAAAEALELVGLSREGKKLARKYSLGMKQRLGLAGALLGRPPLLLLDEPTNGLDPVGIHEIRELIRSLPQRFACTVLLSSHLLSEIELTADTVGVLNHGRLLFEGTPAALKGSNRTLEEGFLALIGADERRRGGGQ